MFSYEKRQHQIGRQKRKLLHKNKNGFGRRNWIDPDKAITKKAMYCMAIESEVL